MKDITPLPIVKGITWAGALDPDLRVFDVIMETKWGTTYNSYVIEGSEKKAVIEMVKSPFGGAHLDVLRQVIAPEEIDYIVINHAEPDHSGALGDFLKHAPQATVVSSKMANNFLKEITNAEFRSQVVRDGDSIDLGGKTLQFINAPFLHWPDSMFTYVPEDGILFSGDVFGCHYSDERMFNDLVEADLKPAQKYYFDVIMSPFKEHMLKAINKLDGLEINAVCPGHGPILRQDPWAVVRQVEEWSADILEKNDPKRVVVAYVSAYGNTARLGEAMAKALEEKGLAVELTDVSEQDAADVVATIDKADALLVGSPTINKDALKPIWDVLTLVSNFKNKGKPAGVFGSYGWSGEAIQMLEDRLKSLGLKVVSPGYKTKLVPSEEALLEAYQYGLKVAEAVANSK